MICDTAVTDKPSRAFANAIICNITKEKATSIAEADHTTSQTNCGTSETIGVGGNVNVFLEIISISVICFCAKSEKGIVRNLQFRMVVFV